MDTLKLVKDTNNNTNEIKNARGDKTSLKERLDLVDSSLESKAKQSDLDIERDRINQITKLPNGSTSGDAELIDIRVGLNGEDFYNAGEAIRYQLMNLYLDRVTNGINMFDKTLVVRGKYLNSTGGAIDSSNGFVGTFIKIKEGTYRTIYTDKIVGYDANKQFVKVCIAGTGNFTIDSTIKYIKASGILDNLDKVMVFAGTVTPTYEGFKTFFEADTSKIAYTLPKYSVEADWLKNNIINENHCNFIEKSKNLFDKSKVTKGFYINPGDGSLVASASFWVSDYIEVSPNTQYTLRYINQFSEFADKVSAGYDGGGGYSDNTSASPKTFTTKSTTKYIRFCGHNSQLDSNQLELGATFTSFEEYEVKINEDLIPIKFQTTKTPKQIISRLFDKTTPTAIKLVGDSITHGMGGTGYAEDGDIIGSFFGRDYRRNTKGKCWANSFRDYLQSKFNCTVTNNAVSGTSTVELVSNFNTLVSNTDNVLICMYGTNNRINATGKNSFEPNLQTIIDNCKTQNIELILMACIPCSIAQEENKTETNYHMEDVNHSIAKICAKNGMQYINVYQKFLDYCWLTGTTIDSLLADGLHPNDKGYDVMFKIICAELGIAIKRDGATW